MYFDGRKPQILYKFERMYEVHVCVKCFTSSWRQKVSENLIYTRKIMKVDFSQTFPCFFKYFKFTWIWWIACLLKMVLSSWFLWWSRLAENKIRCVILQLKKMICTFSIFSKIVFVKTLSGEQWREKVRYSLVGFRGECMEIVIGNPPTNSSTNF